MSFSSAYCRKKSILLFILFFYLTCNFVDHQDMTLPHSAFLLDRCQMNQRNHHQSYVLVLLESIFQFKLRMKKLKTNNSRVSQGVSCYFDSNVCLCLPLLLLKVLIMLVVLLLLPLMLMMLQPMEVVAAPVGGTE